MALSNRELVIQHVADRMKRAFASAKIADAQNLNCLLASLEGMTDTEYNEASSECSGAIS